MSAAFVAFVRRLRAAVVPFAHDDLCRVMGGSFDETSIIYQRGEAKITIGDCRLAKAAVGMKENEHG